MIDLFSFELGFDSILAKTMSGCAFVLKIIVISAQANKLNVYRNDSESWDFTNPNVGKFLRLTFNWMQYVHFFFYKNHVYKNV